MAIIPTLQPDPTLEDIKKLISIENRLEIGELQECQRRTAYKFRNAKKYINLYNGQETESLLINAFKMVPGVTYIDKDPTSGEKITIEIAGGHAYGEIKGFVLGLFQAPKTWHVYDSRELLSDKIYELQEFKRRFGEKAALELWDLPTFKKAQISMHVTGMTRHYFVGATHGIKILESCRTDYQQDKAIKYIAEAERIIFDNALPSKTIKESLCGDCPVYNLCKGNEFSQRDCRNCIHSVPIADGKWSCARWGIEMKNFEACPTHLYIPDYVPGVIIDAGKDFIKYKLKNGVIFNDSENGETIQP